MAESVPPAQQSTNTWVKGAPWLLVALLGMGLIVFLNIRKPVWLVPPWLQYTPFAYAAMALAWVPVLAIALRRLVGGRWVLMLVASVVVGQCVGCLFAKGLYVDVIDLGLWGGSPPMGGLSCGYEPPSDKQRLYRCEMCLGSSDIPERTIRTYEFRVLNGWPVMWLVESGIRYEPGYGLCESTY
ncbi:MAG: hypothetical protein H8E35_05310 [Ardenticatenia bacterium]|nr:hypothetical protein [Ardenticatenia bacterium]